MDVYSAVRAIGDAGSEYVELWGEVPHAYPDMVDKKRLRDVLSTYSMVVTAHAPFTDLSPASPFQPVKGAIEETMEAFVEFCAEVGAMMITVHPGSVHSEALIPQAADSSRGLLNRMAKAAMGRLSVNIENMVDAPSKYHYPLGSTQESLERLLDGVEGSRFTLDTGHAHACGQDPAKWSRELRGRLAEIHLSDNAGSADDHLVPGEGTISFDGLMEGASPDVLVCLELNPHRYSPGQVLGSLAKAKGFLGQGRA